MHPNQGEQCLIPAARKLTHSQKLCDFYVCEEKLLFFLTPFLTVCLVILQVNSSNNLQTEADFLLF
jgi:hypothetical protein